MSPANCNKLKYKTKHIPCALTYFLTDLHTYMHTHIYACVYIYMRMRAEISSRMLAQKQRISISIYCQSEWKRYFSAIEEMSCM